MACGEPSYALNLQTSPKSRRRRGPDCHWWYNGDDDDNIVIGHLLCASTELGNVHAFLT